MTTEHAPSTVTTVHDSGAEIVVTLEDGSTFTLEVEASELADGGWIRKDNAYEHCTYEHCGEDCSCVAPDLTPESKQVIEAWHNDNHDGVFRFCMDEPCRPLIQTMEGWA